MRIKLGILSVLVLFVCIARIQAAHAEEAQELTGRCTITLSGGSGNVDGLMLSLIHI